MRKKILIAVIVVIVVLILLMLGVRRFAPEGGTPIIIKGFGDGNEYLVINAQPDRVALANSHNQSGRVERLYVLGGKIILQNYEWCVQYDLPSPLSIKSSRPHIAVNVSQKPEVEVIDSYSDGVNVAFTDNDYNKAGNQFTSKAKLAVESVSIEFKDVWPFKTKCRDKSGNKIDCPTEFKVAPDNKIAIVSNYLGDSCVAP